MRYMDLFTPDTLERMPQSIDEIYVYLADDDGNEREMFRYRKGRKTRTEWIDKYGMPNMNPHSSSQVWMDNYGLELSELDLSQKIRDNLIRLERGNKKPRVALYDRHYGEETSMEDVLHMKRMRAHNVQPKKQFSELKDSFKNMI